MHAVRKRKFKFQVLPFNSSDRCQGTIVHTKCFELNACVLCFIKMQNRSPFFLAPTDIYFIRFHTFQALYSDLHMAEIKSLQMLVGHSDH